MMRETNIQHGLLSRRRKGGEATIMSSSYNLSNTVIGAGILCIPYAIMCTGLGVGIFLLFLVAALAAFSLWLLVLLGEKYDRLTFIGIAKNTLGRFSVIIEIVIVVYTLGTCCAYPIVIGDNLPLALSSFFPHLQVSRNTISIITTVFVMLPLAIPRQINFLRHTSAIAILCVLFTVFVVCFRFFQMESSGSASANGPIVWFNYNTKMFLALPLMGVAFTCHYNVFKIYSELKTCTSKQMGKVIFISAIFCFAVYFFIGCSGYLSWRGNTLSDILINYGSNDVLGRVARIALSCTVTFSYPVVFHALRGGIEKIMLGDNYETPASFSLRNILESVLITAFCLTVAVLVGDISVVLSFSGSIAGTIIIYIAPALFGLSAFKYRTHPKLYVGCIILLVFGIFFCISGLTVAILNVTGFYT